MHNFMDAKLMAKLLRQALAERNIDLTHSESLELVAQQFGFAEWNILSAKIDEAVSPSRFHLPHGWIKTGDSPQLFDAGLDPETTSAALIKSRASLSGTITGDDFCTLMQSVDATPFHGKRLRLQAELRTEKVATRATLWFRVDGQRGVLHFDNLETRRPDGPLTGTTPWTSRQVVLQVPEEATSLHYGFFLKGEGHCWARNFRLEEVGAGVPLGGNRTSILPEPANLDFMERRLN